jgi:AAHS family 3-hydroxyphenylpropionic acid transporter
MFCGMPFGGGLAALTTLFLPPDFGWRTLFIIGGFLPVLLVPALHFLMRETLTHAANRAADQQVRRALFGEGRITPTLLLWLAFLPTLLILYLFLNWLPTLVIARGLGRAVAPLASLAFNFGSVAGALLIGWLVDRFQFRWPLTLAYLALVAALLALASASGQGIVIALSGAVGFFLLGANYALYGVVPSFYPQSVRGTGSGASIAVGRVGAIAGPLLAGMMMGSGSSASTVMRYMIPVAALAALAVFMLGFRSKGNLHRSTDAR